MTTKTIKTNTAAARILAFVAANPNTTARLVGEALDLPTGTVAPTIKALKTEGKIVTPQVRDEDHYIETGETVKVDLAFVQYDAETGKALRGRPAKALKVTDKGRKAANRIITKAAAIAAERAQAEGHVVTDNGETMRTNTPSGLPVLV